MDMREEINGEFLNDKIKELLPDNALCKFDRNFLAYKLADAINSKIETHFIPKEKAPDYCEVDFEEVGKILRSYGGQVWGLSKEIAQALSEGKIVKRRETE